jgi:hypothetical protein
VTDARSAPLHGLPVGPFPFSTSPFLFAAHALVTSGIVGSQSPPLPSCPRLAPFRPPLLSRSPTARPKPEFQGRQTWRISAAIPSGVMPRTGTRQLVEDLHFQIIGRIRRHASSVHRHPAGAPSRPQRDETEGDYMAEAGASRMLRVRSHTRLASSVPPLTRPPPPRPSLLGFIAHHLSLPEQNINLERKAKYDPSSPQHSILHPGAPRSV